jgi:hypothetical protein
MTGTTIAPWARFTCCNNVFAQTYNVHALVLLRLATRDQSPHRSARMFYLAFRDADLGIARGNQTSTI